MAVGEPDAPSRAWGSRTSGGGCWPADPGTGAVGHIYCSILPDGELRRTAIHELTHHVTMITGQKAVEKQCRRRRTDGNPDAPILGYSSGVDGRGGWVHPSIGRHRPERCSEGMSTGIEMIHSRKHFHIDRDVEQQQSVLEMLAAL